MVNTDKTNYFAGCVVLGVGVGSGWAMAGLPSTHFQYLLSWEKSQLKAELPDWLMIGVLIGLCS